MNIEDRLNKYLMIEQEEVDYDMEDTNPVFDMMVDLVSSLDADSLDEDQQDLLGNILDTLESLGIDAEDDEFDDSEEDGLEEDTDLSEKRIQKISRRAHLAMRKDYKRNKAKFKMMNKRFRKTAAFKIWKRKHKRLVRAGRTKTKKYV
jgi:hypothetical protein